MPIQVLLVSFFEKCWMRISGWDTQLFLAINTKWTNPFLDSIFPWWREANTWIPLYLFLVIFAVLNFRKTALFWILTAVVTATLTDQLSSTLLKNWIARPRPCRDDFLAGQVRLILNNCSGGYSFPSSHATNHFGFAMFLFLTLRPVMGKWSYLFFIWAATVCYGQVYVGVHYPVDVFCGAVLGSLIGWITGTFYNRKIGPLLYTDTNV